MEYVENRALWEPSQGMGTVRRRRFCYYQPSSPRPVSFLNSIQPFIKSIMELKTDSSIAVLDAKAARKIREGALLLYRKSTYGDRYLNFRSDHLLQRKYAVVNTLMSRAETLNSDKRKAALQHVQCYVSMYWFIVSTVCINWFSPWYLFTLISLFLDCYPA